jgi:hypothetical protein
MLAQTRLWVLAGIAILVVTVTLVVQGGGEASDTTVSSAASSVAAGSFVAVSAGGGHSCAIRSDSTVACWGNNDYGQSTPPPESFIAITAGAYHTCGIRTDSTVACWGVIDSEEVLPPSGTFSEISTGGFHSCGIRTDNTVACWGNNGMGQSTPPTGSFIGIGSGAWNACGIRSDGAVTCWGDNDLGQSTPPTGSFITVAGSLTQSCGVQSDGTIICWGEGPTPPSALFTTISASDSHWCGIQSDGSVSCWGGNDFGQATPPSGSFIDIASGGNHSCGIRSDNTVICWGDNAKGQSTPPAIDELPESTENTISVPVVDSTAISENILSSDGNSALIGEPGLRWPIWVIDLTTGEYSKPAGYDREIFSKVIPYATVDGNYVIGWDQYNDNLELVSLIQGSSTNLFSEDLDRWEVLQAGSGLDAKRPEIRFSGFDKYTGMMYFSVANETASETSYSQSVKSIIETGFDPQPVGVRSRCHVSRNWSPDGSRCIVLRAGDDEVARISDPEAGSEDAQCVGNYEESDRLWLDRSRVVFSREPEGSPEATQGRFRGLLTCTVSDSDQTTETEIYSFPEGDRRVEFIGVAGGKPIIGSWTLDRTSYEVYIIEDSGESRLLQTFPFEVRFL